MEHKVQFYQADTVIAGTAELSIQVYPYSSNCSTLSAVVNVYYADHRPGKLYDGVKKLCKTMGIQVVAIDDIHSLSFADLESSSHPELEFIKKAIITNLASLGSCRLVADNVVSFLPSPFHEKELIETLVSEELQERFSTLLPDVNGKNPKRYKLLDRLAHLDFISSNSNLTRTDVSAMKDADIAALLMEKGAQNFCYVISENKKWDANYWAIDTILSRSSGSGCFILLSCLAGELYYLETEEVNSRFIFHK